jgi:hypothetical protein
MSSSETRKTQHVPERKPGRSFTDPRKPLGAELIERADPLGGDRDEGVYGRAPIHAHYGHGVAERAKAVAVLRKAEELMATDNPSGDTEEGQRRALELAAGRIGITLHDYDRMVAGDHELESLQAAVLEAARARTTKL